MPTYSVVIPICNEEETIPELFRRLTSQVAALDGPLQILFVDDGSRDRSLDMIRDLHRQNPAVSYVSLARNFGHQNAISAGLQFATGEAVIVMDGDLQDPPELIPALAQQWRAGFQVVYAQRTKRFKGSAIKNSAAYVFYRVLRRLTNIEIPPDTGDFCLMDRRVVDVLLRLPERTRYVRGLRAWTGFRSAAVPFVRDERFAGRTKYGYRKLFNLATSGIVSFSRVPLRLATYLGLATAGVAVAAALVLWYWFATDRAPHWSGYALMAAAVLFVGAVQLICLGILGEYVGRIHEEVKGRPLFIVNEAVGVGEDPAGSARNR